jgi:two-component system, OmpR family, sensor kinase
MVEQPVSHASDRFLSTLEQLLAIRSTELDGALDQAADLIAAAVGADKVDAFLYEPASESLVAAGTSRTPMGRKQLAIGMDRMPLANGGRTAEVFRTGVSHLTGRADQDPAELRGLTEALGIRSMMCARLGVDSEARGVLSVASATPDLWTEDDLRFVEAAARWVGLVAIRAELGERLARHAEEQGRRAAADELIAILAHDLRNHLAPIRGRLQLMQRWAERERQQTAQRHAAEVAKGIDRLGHLVADLLDSTRLEQGLFTLECRPTDLVALAREVATVLTGTSNRVEVVACDPEVTAVVDGERVRQTLENLLANAFKHSPDSAAVTVEISREARADGAWGLISVIDSGPGVSREVKDRLFERFATGPGSQGLGLGLYLGRRVAEAHGGSLTVESAPGRGSRFTLALPVEGHDVLNHHRSVTAVAGEI